MNNVAVVFALFICACRAEAGAWGNVLGNSEELAQDSPDWRGTFDDVMNFAEAAVNEHWAGCKSCSHISNFKIDAIITASRQVMTYTEDGVSAKRMQLVTWDGTVEDGPLVLGVKYELVVDFVHQDKAPVDAAHTWVAEAYSKTRHNMTLFGDREGLFSLVTHVWQPTGAKGTEDAPPSSVLSAWYGLPATAPQADLVLVCYNIWNFNNPWPRRLELLTRKIKEGSVPDVIAFQEVRHDNAGAQLGPGSTRHQVDHLLWRLQQLGLYQIIWQPSMSYLQLDRGLAAQTEGPAIFTRLPVLRSGALKLTRFWPEDSGDEHQRLVLSATVRTQRFGAVNILTTHLSLSNTARMNNVLEICRYAKELSHDDGGKVTVLMGDLNMIPSDPAMEFLLGNNEFKGETCDFRDVWLLPGEKRHEQPKHAESGATFNNLRGALEKRIDFILVRGDVPDDAFGLFEVFGSRALSEDQVPPSDHLGLRVTVSPQQHADPDPRPDPLSNDEL